MRKFSIKTLLFVVPILLLAVIIEIFLRLIPNDYLHKKKYLDAHSCDIETLILGSSHSFYGIDPNYFSNNTFNAKKDSFASIRMHSLNNTLVSNNWINVTGGRFAGIFNDGRDNIVSNNIMYTDNDNCKLIRIENGEHTHID